MPLANRATIGNMSPEFGSTAAIFPIDEVTIDYMKLTGRSAEQIQLVEDYAKAQGLWHDPSKEVEYSEYIELDLSTVVPSISGPKRPQDRIELSDAKDQFAKDIHNYAKPGEENNSAPVTTGDGSSFELANGAVAIASITSCTNTSNPSVMLAAGLLARNARKRGLNSKPWVKTSIAPGSKVVTEYYKKANLIEDLEALNFFVVGYGCTTCIGNSGPLDSDISQSIQDNDLAVSAVLSGNRNFEGRISPDVKMNYLASPPLVIAYALAGTMDFDFENQPLGQDSEGVDVYLKDLWPSPEEVESVIASSISTDMFDEEYGRIFEGDDRWKALQTPEGAIFEWDDESTYVRKPTFFDGMGLEAEPVSDIKGARVLAKLGDSVTTDHISPAGSFKADTPAGKYLIEHGVERKDFNSFGSRRGNHEVMIRGTFANIRLQNQLPRRSPGWLHPRLHSGGWSADLDLRRIRELREGRDPACHPRWQGIRFGSSRDWAAKGTKLLGVEAVITESFERIHRSNLIGMGVVPLQFPAGESADSLGLDGTETFSISGITELNEGKTPKTVKVSAAKEDGTTVDFDAVVRIDTPGEADYYRNGGILQYVLRQLAGS